jgi:hypothetical protein
MEISSRKCSNGLADPVWARSDLMVLSVFRSNSCKNLLGINGQTRREYGFGPKQLRRIMKIVGSTWPKKMMLCGVEHHDNSSLGRQRWWFGFIFITILSRSITDSPFIANLGC